METTPIPAKVLSIDRLTFGENKPQLGSYRNGWLDLSYHQNQRDRHSQAAVSNRLNPSIGRIRCFIRR
jgi:hypothetical protein